MMVIRDEHLKITVPERHLHGGQTCGDTPRGVCVEHLPTGLKAYCDQERSQLRNKRVAIAMIEYGLAELGWTP